MWARPALSAHEYLDQEEWAGVRSCRKGAA
jgi:hypothetical protein